MVLNVNSATIGASAAAESAVSAEIAAATSAAAAALLAVLPMGADMDSIAFAEALNAAGASYLGAAGEHVASRGMFSGSQGLAGATYAVTDAISNTALAI